MVLEKSRRYSLWKWLLVLMGVVWMGSSVAWAHSRVEVGEYVIVIGWENEPVIVGERNALVLEVLAGETAVADLEGSLELEVVYAGRSFLGTLSPIPGQPGYYQMPIYPTVRGQYEVQVRGMIAETDVEVTMQPEEVLSARALQFPEAQPEARDIERAVEALEAEVQGQLRLAYGLGGAGLLVGLLGLGVAMVAWRRGGG
ncbi:MAG TPA: hypothetical protein VLL52_01520 [Anaerolineae bacterium]|nr:hypothetical protein [Anaerolineae bacterium]